MSILDFCTNFQEQAVHIAEFHFPLYFLPFLWFNGIKERAFLPSFVFESSISFAFETHHSQLILHDIWR